MKRLLLILLAASCNVGSPNNQEQIDKLKTEIDSLRSYVIENDSALLFYVYGSHVYLSMRIDSIAQ